MPLDAKTGAAALPETPTARSASRRHSLYLHRPSHPGGSRSISRSLCRQNRPDAAAPGTAEPRRRGTQTEGQSRLPAPRPARPHGDRVGEGGVRGTGLSLRPLALPPRRASLQQAAGSFTPLYCPVLNVPLEPLPIVLSSSKPSCHRCQSACAGAGPGSPARRQLELKPLVRSGGPACTKALALPQTARFAKPSWRACTYLPQRDPGSSSSHSQSSAGSCGGTSGAVAPARHRRIRGSFSG